MDFDFKDLAPRDRYKLLVALVVPRPIALVTSLSPEGVVNAAPYSFFNVFSQEPALCVLGIEERAPRRQKDTASNIALTHQFVVNLVDEAIVESMNICAVDFPSGQSEIEAAGFTTASSLTVAPPRIAEAPAALECRLYITLNPGHGRELVIGEITAIHARDGLVDPDTLRVNWEQYRPVGRLFANLYCRTRDTFKVVRRSYAEWSEGRRS